MLIMLIMMIMAMVMMMVTINNNSLPRPGYMIEVCRKRCSWKHAQYAIISTNETANDFLQVLFLVFPYEPIVIEQ